MNDYSGQRLFDSWYIPDFNNPLGRGSFGMVYELLSYNEIMKPTAVKIISIPASKQEYAALLNEVGATREDVNTKLTKTKDKLLNEIAIMLQVSGHSNCVSCMSYCVIPHEDCFGWDVLIQMEKLTSLDSYYRRKGVIANTDIIRLGMDMCSALTICKANNIIHRDIKPANIMVKEVGETVYYKLTDFGVARTLRNSGTMSIAGTMEYMAPELFMGEGDARVDIYSLGMVLYELLNANRMPFMPDYPAPYTDEDVGQARTRRLRGETLPEPLYASGTLLGRIIKKACAYKPEDRYQSAQEMYDALKQALDEEREKVIFTVPPVGRYQPTERKKRKDPPVQDDSTPQPGTEKPEDTTYHYKGGSAQGTATKETGKQKKSSEGVSNESGAYRYKYTAQQKTGKDEQDGTYHHKGNPAPKAAKGEPKDTTYHYKAGSSQETAKGGTGKQKKSSEGASSESGAYRYKYTAQQKSARKEQNGTYSHKGSPTPGEAKEEHKSEGKPKSKENSSDCRKKDDNQKKSKKPLLIVAVCVIVLLVALLMLCSGEKTSTNETDAAQSTTAVTMMEATATAGATEANGSTSEKATGGTRIQTDSDVFWSLSADGVLTLSGSGTTPNYVYRDTERPWDSEAITAVVVEDGITAIGNGLFESCWNLQSVSLPDSVISIGDMAFMDCSRLSEITMPKELASLGQYAFSGCLSLTKITIPQGLDTIETRAFYCTGLQSVVIPNGVHHIEEEAFFACPSLQSVTFPDTVTEIGSLAFAECPVLSAVQLPQDCYLVNSFDDSVQITYR